MQKVDVEFVGGPLNGKRSSIEVPGEIEGLTSILIPHWRGGAYVYNVTNRTSHGRLVLEAPSLTQT